MDFRANGKLLISGEYAVLDGALALAVPCRFGQRMNTEDGDRSLQPKLVWKSFLEDGSLWFTSKMDLITLRIIETDHSGLAEKLVRILENAKKLNPGFFDSCSRNLTVTTRLEFPKDWGLGSSSTLISLISRLVGTDPFELNRISFGSSGYDIACADSDRPLLYQLKEGRPYVEKTDFCPVFRDRLYFVYLNRKQDTQKNVSKNYSDFKPDPEWLNGISAISYNMLKTDSVTEFELLMNLHEEMISNTLGFEKAKDLYFSDYGGSIKSLGAWGGDFVMITSVPGFEEYFRSKGFETIIPFDRMVL